MTDHEYPHLPSRPPRGLAEKLLAFVGIDYRPPAEIDREAWDAAKNDPATAEFVREAMQEGERLKAEGLIQP